MRKVFALGLLGALMLSGSAMAQELAEACDRPVPPEIPDGATASEDDLVAARDAVIAFLEASEDYGACLEEEEERLGEYITRTEQQGLLELYNSNVEDQQDVGAAFNNAVTAFREANPE